MCKRWGRWITMYRKIEEIVEQNFGLWTLGLWDFGNLRSFGEGYLSQLTTGENLGLCLLPIYLIRSLEFFS